MMETLVVKRLNLVNYPDYIHCFICDKEQLQNHSQVNQDFFVTVNCLCFPMNYEKLTFSLTAKHHSVIFIVNFEHIQTFLLVSLMLPLSMYLFSGLLLA